MEINKNEIYELNIEDVSDDGLGIGHLDGLAVFVKDAAVGDLAQIKITKVKKNYAYGRLEQVLAESPFRISPECPVARQCGGCTLQHITYEKELSLKKDRVLSCLERIGGIKNPEELLDKVYGMENNCYRYRNKMQFPFGKDREGKTVTGFYAGRTHSLISVDDCIIGHEANKYIEDAVKNWADKYKVSVYDEKTGGGLLRHLLIRIGFSTDEVMVCIVINGGKVPYESELIECIRKSVMKRDLKPTSIVLNINKEKTNKILGAKSFAIYGKDYIEDYIGDIKFRISANSFYQVNPFQTERLYSKALEYAGLHGGETVWDMYCGIGTISLFLSQKAKKVYGVEIVPQAIEDANKNAELNKIGNAEFFTGKAEEIVEELYTSENGEKYRADVVVVDPPRKGCDTELLNTITEMGPERIVYVSCNPATLARDLKILSEKGYDTVKFSVFDQFSRSMHVETVAILERPVNI